MLRAQQLLGNLWRIGERSEMGRRAGGAEDNQVEAEGRKPGFGGN